MRVFFLDGLPGASGCTSSPSSSSSAVRFLLLGAVSDWTVGEADEDALAGVGGEMVSDGEHGEASVDGRLGATAELVSASGKAGEAS